MPYLYIAGASLALAAVLGCCLAAILELSHIRTTGNVQRRSGGSKTWPPAR